MENNVKRTGFFLAIHNTVYNLTEYVFEDPLLNNEVFKDVQINERFGIVTIITELNNGNNIRVRGFSLESIFAYNIRKII